MMTDRRIIDETSVPRLPTGVRLKFDDPRDQWVILAPERMYVLDQVALAIVRECDGVANVGGIIDALAEDFAAPRAQIGGDVVHMLQDFADKGVIDA
jgi:pyrroloquinoline quinone biosynthesis protein D